MFIRFIAHAGFYIEEKGYSIFLDPWFFDSVIERPIIESIGGGFKTIDFQIPQSTDSPERYAPDAILISHFHPHHSPARDIRALCENSLSKGKKIKIFFPTPSATMEENIRAKVPGDVEKVGVSPGDTFSIGPFSITAKEHTVPYHTAWHVASPSGSLLHIADGRLNKDNFLRRPDPVWENLHGISPSFLFLSAGGHSERAEKNNEHLIIPAGIFTPVEAAEIVKIVTPKAASLVGIYNHSIWKNRHEYIQPAPFCEDEFQWAASWLSPQTRHVRLTPGMTLGIGEDSISPMCEVYMR